MNISRRLVLTAITTLLGVGEGYAHAAERSPNIVVILTDDMGFSDLGCYGGEIHTPNLDALADGGVRFAQFYNTARCCPTRACLLTGLYPHQAGVGHMMEDRGPEFPGYRGDLNSSPTIAEALRPAGYRSYAVGKWHVTRHLDQDGPKHNWPLQRGFDRFYGMISGGGSYFDPFTLARGNQRITPENDPEYRPETYYLTDAIAEHATRFLSDHVEQQAEKPFFLYVAFTAAHWPLHALPEDIAKYQGKYDEGYEPIRQARFEKAARLGLISSNEPRAPAPESWATVANKAREAACMEVYAAMVDRMDQGVGRIVAELKRTGQLDNTLILYMQDNGGCAELNGRNATKGRQDGPRQESPSLPPLKVDELQAFLTPIQTRDGHPVRQGPNVFPGPADTFIAYGRGWATVSNTPFREYKHWVHEGGISTPLIAHWPRGIAARGQTIRAPGHLIDVMATCLALAGAKRPADATPLEGRNLIPACNGERIARDALYWEHEGNRAVRVGDWKAVAKGPGADWELYDIGRDRVEMNNLAEREPSKLAELVGKWEHYAKRTGVLPWIWKPAYAGLSLSPAAPESAEALKPNVLLICVDDLKPLLGCYGDKIVKTPNIDRLAERSVLFERAYCNQAVCSPSRNALLTGLRPQTLGIYDLPTNFRRARPGAVTMPQLFKESGWRTEGLGKIFHVGHGNTEDPVSWSVPHWRANVVAYALPENKAPMGLTREEARFANQPAGNLPKGAAYEAADVPDNTYPDGALAEEAVRRLQALKNTSGAPFFLAVGFVKPHLPFVAPKRYWDFYDRAEFMPAEFRTPPAGAPTYAPQFGGELRQYQGIPENGPLDDELQRTLIHGYHAATSYTDAQIGRVLDELDRTGLAKNTIIVLWGDHGWHLGDHGIWCKHTNYEQAARIPLLVSAPGLQAGKRTAALVESVDIFPTLCELAGLQGPSELEGRSFAATLRDASAPTKDHAIHVYPRSVPGKGAVLGRAIRTARYRLVEWKPIGAPPESAEFELYDYASDPLETKNLAADKPEVVAELRAILARHAEAKPQLKTPAARLQGKSVKAQ